MSQLAALDQRIMRLEVANAARAAARLPEAATAAPGEVLTYVAIDGFKRPTEDDPRPSPPMIGIIKAVRQAANWSLKEGKDAFDSAKAGNRTVIGPMTPERAKQLVSDLKDLGATSQVQFTRS